MTIRDKLYRRWRSEEDTELRSLYKFYRNKITRTKQDFENKTLHNMLTETKDISAIWSKLRKIGLTRQKSKLASDYISEDDLAEYFSETHCRHPECSEDFVTEILEKIKLDPTKPVFVFQTVTTETVAKAILESIKKF